MTAVLITPEHLANRLGSLWFSSAALSGLSMLAGAISFNFSMTWAAFEETQNICVIASGPRAVCLDTGDPGKGIHELGGTWWGVVRRLSGLGWWVGSGGSQHPYGLSCPAVDPCGGRSPR